MEANKEFQFNNCIKCGKNCRKEYCYRHNPDYLAKKKIKERERMKIYGKTEAHKDAMRRYQRKIKVENN
ncbi:Hypothetical protein PACV_244 [Pacmanvirus A23]|uniref:Hypothetical protein n=1 Tax=Pacmanvirus A23 TaxID=1932881 RepID=UPI000A093226|nr:Hypothetical protein B9W72_gp242 [Pacmanvirus A23]SIP85959.1 Hypothetical protein PACV_244 [Pacmanvirus A23]